MTQVLWRKLVWGHLRTSVEGSRLKILEGPGFQEGASHRLVTENCTRQSQGERLEDPGLSSSLQATHQLRALPVAQCGAEDLNVCRGEKNLVPGKVGGVLWEANREGMESRDPKGAGRASWGARGRPATAPRGGRSRHCSLSSPRRKLGCALQRQVEAATTPGGVALPSMQCWHRLLASASVLFVKIGKVGSLCLPSIPACT